MINKKKKKKRKKGGRGRVGGGGGGGGGGDGRMGQYMPQHTATPWSDDDHPLKINVFHFQVTYHLSQ